MAVFLVFDTGATTFSSKQLLSCTHEAEWSPFQTHYFSENLVAPEIEPWPLDLQPGTQTTRPPRRSFSSNRQLKLYNQATGLLKNNRLILRVLKDVISTVEVIKRYI
jgi:hypothetical protein